MALESLANVKDVLVVLGAAGIVIPVLLRFGISSSLGFLIVGLLLGPHILGQLATAVPAVSAFSLTNNAITAGLAELGVVFLLFLIGLELSFERLKTMRKLVFGLGGLQVLISTALLAAAAKVLGFDRQQSVIIGMALALSSTAIVIQLFADSKRLGSQAGRISFAVLLMQDVAVIPMLLLVNAMAATGNTNLLLQLSWALAQAALAAILIIGVGRFALTPLLRLVASAKSPDLFMAAVLFIAIGAGAAATLAGLSMALGAFMAGLVLAETEYRRAIETILEPFKGLLLGLFFLLVGLNLNLSLLSHSLLQILAVTVIVIIVKALVIMALGRIFKLPQRSVFEAAMVLGPGGEFAFVLLSAAAAQGLLTANQTAPVLLVVTLSMMLIPLLAQLARRLRRWSEQEAATPEMVRELPPSASSHVIIAGFGRVGTLVADMLREQNIPYIAVDLDIDNVTRGRKASYDVYFGDAANPAFLIACGMRDAKALALTMDSPARIESIVRMVRKDDTGIKIIARARDERHAQKLYAAGVTEAIPETIEASLQLAEALLVETGVPMGLAIAAVHERRDVSRKLLGRPNRRAEIATARKRLKNTTPSADA
jgi:Kef-type K+ transport system membrane component KefB/voltage-gated potassium channel Kch